MREGPYGHKIVPFRNSRGIKDGDWRGGEGFMPSTPPLLPHTLLNKKEREAKLQPKVDEKEQSKVTKYLKQVAHSGKILSLTLCLSLSLSAGV